VDIKNLQVLNYKKKKKKKPQNREPVIVLLIKIQHLKFSSSLGLESFQPNHVNEALRRGLKA
jgi:hypothetical protein